MQIVVDYFYLLYFFIYLIFYCFSSDFASVLGVGVFMVFGLCGRFCPYLGCGVTHFSVPLPLHLHTITVIIIIVMWLLKDNLGFNVEIIIN